MRAYALAIVATEDLEQFEEGSWRIVHIYRETGVKMAHSPSPVRFMGDTARKRDKGLSQVRDCECQRCGWTWKKRTGRRMPVECPKCKSRRWWEKAA